VTGNLFGKQWIRNDSSGLNFVAVIGKRRDHLRDIQEAGSIILKWKKKVKVKLSTEQAVGAYRMVRR
jgi:hypothetical protein